MAVTHAWGDRRPIDHTTTFRHCARCPLIMVTRHEPDNDPPHWTEWQRGDGQRFQSARRPMCEPIPHPIARGPRETTAGDAGRK